MNNTTSPPMELSNRADKVEQTIQATVYVVTFILGSLGNLLVLLVLKAKGSRRTVNDIFIMNLATADLTLIFFIPILIFKLFATFPHSLFFCHFIQPFMTTTFFVSVFTLTSMAVHRCRAILHPFWPEVQKRSVYLWITVMWLLSLVLLVPFMVVNTVDDPPINCKETWSAERKRIYTVVLMVLQFLLPMVITSCAYALICFDLFKPNSLLPRFGNFYRRQSSASDSNSNARPSRSGAGLKKRKEDIRIGKTLAIIVILFAVCTLPGQVAWMLLDYGNEYQKRLAVEVFFKIYVIFAVFHSCWNPIVYGTLTRQFRRGYLKYMAKIFCWHTNIFTSGKYSSRPLTTRNISSRQNSRPNCPVNGRDSVEVEARDINMNNSAEDLPCINPLKGRGTGQQEANEHALLGTIDIEIS